MMSIRTLSLALLAVAGVAVGGVLTALIGAEELEPRDGFVLWPIVVMVMALAGMFFIGRYLLPPPTRIEPPSLLPLVVIGFLMTMRFFDRVVSWRPFQISTETWPRDLFFVLIFALALVLYFWRRRAYKRNT